MLYRDTLYHSNGILAKKLDHMNLNMDVDFIPDHIQPTSENLVMLIWDELKPHLKGYTLHKIKLIETDSIYVEYYGE